MAGTVRRTRFTFAESQQRRRALAATKPGWWRRLNHLREADLRHRETRYRKRHEENANG